MNTHQSFQLSNSISAMTRLLSACLIATLLILVGCVSASVTPLATAPEGLEPVKPSEVAIYDDTTSVQCDYSRVALVHVDAQEEVTRGEMLTKAKKAAAKKGANGLILVSSSTHKGSYTVQDGDMIMTQSPGGKARTLAVYEERPCE